MANSWILDALPISALDSARAGAARQLLESSLGIADSAGLGESRYRFVAEALELALLDHLERTGRSLDERESQKFEEDRIRLATDAFHVFRVLPCPETPADSARYYLRLGCIGILGDRGADVARLLKSIEWPSLDASSENWGERTSSAIMDVWLRMLRKSGWEDLQAVQSRVVDLRERQADFESNYLASLEDGERRQAAWELVLFYHLAKAAELLAVYTTEGRADDGFDVREQLQAQFDRASIACVRAELIEWDSLTRLLAHTAEQLVDNSIWSSTRAVNPRITEFVEKLVARTNPRPLFDLLPPQRKALREAGLRGGNRAIVVNLPTSSGKTFIAQFRMLQALNQFDREHGWVVYLAPTRALVNQICTRLRRDFAPLGINVERVSPALEIDSLESGLLRDEDAATQFRVLVTTPEKLDLMIRGGWEEEIGRPLTLVVVDEAHNLGHGDRGIKLELLLATVNRECRNAQFLLLTPFIRNAKEVAAWLAPDSHSTVELSVEWAPNDRVIALSKPVPTGGRTFSVSLETLHTSHDTLEVSGDIRLCEGRPLGMTLRKVQTNASNLAAVTAQCLKARGSTIILSARPDWCWAIADKFRTEENLRPLDEQVALVQQYLRQEFGDDFELATLLNYRVGVHHAGLSDEAKALMEWLFENGRLDVLVATTTIAQGVNFPVAAVVFAQHQFYDGTRTAPMPASDFWNIAGRAGRADQANAGIIALAAPTDQKAEELRSFVSNQVLTLNSTLIEMVGRALEAGRLDELHTLFNRPEWSAFLQYLAHTFRQVGDPDRFAQQIDRILRGTLGFQKLREANREVAQRLVESAQAYGARIADKPLKLVDTTGFSWETISITLRKLSEERISEDVWEPELFHGRNRDLQKLMGILLDVPELRENLTAATGGRAPDGDKLARIVTDWVNGAPLSHIAREYFSVDRAGNAVSPRDAMTECCRNLYGKLAQTASWGLAALQAMTLGSDFERMSDAEQRTVRNLPSRVYYGVASDDAIPLRLLGVPRNMAQPLADLMANEERIHVRERPLRDLRSSLAAEDGRLWRQAMGHEGEVYWRVWSVLESVR